MDLHKMNFHTQKYKKITILTYKKRLIKKNKAS